MAEDNPVNQRLMNMLLRKFGFAVTVADNGAIAVEHLQRQTFDVVLMDVQMPEMDGLEATRFIRGPNSDVLDPKVTIIAVTANAMAGDREMCLDAGMDDYLAKPVKRSDLNDILAKWLLS